jgi:hypothetical protein
MAQPSVKGKLGRPILVKKVLVTVVQPGTSVSDERPPQITEAR